MNLEIANMVMNIGEATKGFDWGDFWTALFASFFGALAAFGLNILKQITDEKKDKLKKLNKLINSAQMFGDKTCAYFRNLYNSKISNTALSLDIVNVDEQEFSFLGNYNIHFLYFLNYFNQLINHLKTIVEQYNKATLLTYSDNLFDKKEDVVKIHNQLYEQITEDIFILRYINHIFLKHLYITKDRYFMNSFANDNFLKKTFPALEPIFLEAIKKYSGFKAYLQIDKTFKKNYVNKTNTTCQKCNFQYWLNFVTSNIKSFFAPPEICQKKNNEDKKMTYKKKLKNFFAAKTNFFNKEEEIENNNSKIEQITTINLYPIIENFGKFIPITLILFVLFNFLYNFFYFLNYDLSLTHLLKLSDYYEGGAVCFSIFCVLISFVYLCKNKFIKPLKIFIDIFILSIAILFLITNFINLENVNIIPIFVLIFLIGSLFLKFENHIILANLMNVIIVIILFASFNFLMEYNSYTKLVQTKQNEEYYLMRQISDGVLVRNKDGSILFYRWENVKNIKYSILTSANFIFKFWEKDFKLKLINKAPKYIIIKGRNQQEGRNDL